MAKKSGHPDSLSLPSTGQPGKPAAAAKPPVTRKKQRFPLGWDEARVKEAIAYYDQQTEDEELAEYEAGMNIEGLTVMLVPRDLVPEVRRLIGRKRGT